MGTPLLRPEDRAIPRKREQVIAALHSRAPRNANALKALADVMRKGQAEALAVLIRKTRMDSQE